MCTASKTSRQPHVIGPYCSLPTIALSSICTPCLRFSSGRRNGVNNFFFQYAEGSSINRRLGFWSTSLWGGGRCTRRFSPPEIILYPRNVHSINTHFGY